MVGGRGRAATLTVISMAVILLAQTTPAQAADSTQYAGDSSRGLGVAIPFSGFTDRNGQAVPISGAVGADLVLGSTAQPYLPCQNYDPLTGTGDTFINACEVPGSYTTYTRFAAGQGILFPHGYFVPDVQPDYVNDGSLRTDWGARAAGLSLEFYPDVALDQEYVHSRFYVDYFNHRANGWTYSYHVGTIKLVTLADPGTARIIGSVTRNGAAPAAKEIKFTIFGGDARSSADYPISSFAVTYSNGTDWTSGAMYAGSQRVTVDDTATGHQCVYDLPRISGPDNRLDFDVARPGFGRDGGHCNF
ncbi:hypothetical protein FrCorBMG51_20035 [Protofrankia coriariae]|uniref:Uncharacterized protein n=2 Tax=Protofrankia coriariae TaxID=1562887 RepID=A0ABR5F053_9ACTN|nr:hypothetical protein FrCorBMG51_20035 [Protofrankia coriariae]